MVWDVSGHFASSKRGMTMAAKKKAKKKKAKKKA
jgi:hypothetical protein